MPGKNVKLFCGLPLIAWTIIQLRCSHSIDEVWLSTDDDEIEAVGLEYGAHVARRPDWPDADTVNGIRPTSHAIKAAIDYGGHFDCLVTTIGTSPLRLPGDIDRLVAKYQAAPSPDIEAVFATRLREVVLREEEAGGLRMTLFEKRPIYFTSVGGTKVHGLDFWLRMHGAEVDNDEETATDLWHGLAANKQWPVTPYVPVEAWQNTECDTAEEFELAEVLMEHYILRGRGAEVYHEYARRKE